MSTLLTAIIDDDSTRVRRLLSSDPRLVNRTFDKARLYDSGIHHWLYVGDTPLHLAAAGHRVEIVPPLIAAGADTNAAGNHRRGAPLHYAADGCPGLPFYDEDNQVKTIGCLIEAGASINAQDKNGASPLHRAVRTRCAAAVKHLLERGADPTLRNKPGSTPFHLAVQNTGRGGSGTDAAVAGQRRIIELFLLAGVSPGLKDANGKSVRDWARTQWIREMVA
jgi:Ankyrin repeats (many copies)/Ankyrin repeat